MRGEGVGVGDCQPGQRRGEACQAPSLCHRWPSGVGVLQLLLPAVAGARVSGETVTATDSRAW